ncbi:glycine C-acetyltransferase, partial [Bradyrhizobium sp. USDA 336]|uniref:glycine C-acetyltransferase n=1 Tax=Bradyrhizobium sp. USDA 336 TaxID=3156311 RepID=UPI003832B8BB
DGHKRELINLCANNYLGLANHEEIVAAAQRALAEFGFGMASVRFICGTHVLHRQLEEAIARYVGADDAILFPACFDANTGVFDALLTADDAIVSDSLNHASIVDGVRLCKAQRYRFANGNMNALEDALRQARENGSRFILIATDGVFSMDGYVADLPTVCDLADRFGAMVMVDDCHATGHLGPQGRGTPALTGTEGKIDIISGTFGKSLGGAAGGFVAGRSKIVEVLRQRARPYLFSNSIPPAMAAGALRAIEIAANADDRRSRLGAHVQRFRQGLVDAGFDVVPGTTPIIPVMFFDAHRAKAMAQTLDRLGVYVAGFSYPVVPEGQARIRTQMSAALTDDDINAALQAFRDARELLAL